MSMALQTAAEATLPARPLPRAWRFCFWVGFAFVPPLPPWGVVLCMTWWFDGYTGIWQVLPTLLLRISPGDAEPM